MSVPTNLIPTKITGLPEYTGTSQAGYFPYVLDGTTYKVQFSSVASAGEVPPSRTLTAGTGLVGGGDLSANRVFAIANGGVGAQQLDTTGVVAGAYGNASNIPTVTVDANGRVTSVTTSPVVATGYVPESRTITAGTGLIGGGSLANNITLSLNLSSATPQALGTATAGVSTAAARGDHVHPAVNLSDTNETQGALPLGRGGTGDALSPVAGAVVYSTGTKLAMTNPGAVGQVLVSTGTDEPVWSFVGSGTVTSVNASGGSTGMTFTGGPITTSGTLTLGGTLATGSGGTGLTGTPTNGQLLIGNGTGYALSTLTAGTAVSITNAAGSITIDNTAPDQIVSLTAGTAISVTGTYPNFTVTNTAPDQIVSLTGAGTTTISGTYPNFTITSNDQFTGTVTSVAASGGTTGLTFSGSPITSAGTLTLGGTLAVTNGGTGATTASGARTNLGAAASGANSDITSLSGITGGISTADFVAFDTTNVTPPTTGQIAWSVDDGTLDVGLNGGSILKVGQQTLFYAKNTSGGTIPIGTPVMFTGVVGASGKLTFGLAVANGSVPPEYMMGVTTQNVVNNAFGYITSFGLVRGFNTSGAPYGETWADGDLLYFSPATPGGWTKVEPQAPNIHVPVAVVVNAATGGSGSIFVRMIQSERLGELQDVEINGGGPAAGQVLIYDASQSRWENNTLTAGSNVTITNGNGSITIAATEQFTGTVTSVAASGGTTGLTFSGSPITSAGTLTLGGTLAIGSGGTGATTAGGARTALGAAASGANTDITSVALTSGTILNAPTSGTDIVNKAYADSIAAGINFHQSVRLATVAPLPANTYNNGSSGVGATLTGNANGALSIDGVAVVAGNRVLVKDEVAQANNGVYVVTQTGSGSTPYILTRATDFDSAGSGVDQIDAGDFFLVTAGSTLANTSWVQQTPLPITVGTTAIVFSQFGAPVLYSAGTGLSLAGTVFSIANTGVSASTYGSASQVPVLAVNAQGQITSASNTSISIAASQVTSGSLAVAQGGTGLSTTPTNGQLLIGNGTGYSLSTLSAGTGISVSNGSGSVTVTNTAPDQIVTITGGGATVVTGTYPNFTVSTTTGTGTVTSVDVSGGSTGLSFTGGPITSSGIITMGGTLGVANGGTGATTLSSGYLLKGNGTSAVSASVIYDDGTNVGIGTASPGARLDVNGTIQVRTSGFEFGRILTNNVNSSTGGLTLQYNAAGVFTDGIVLNGSGNVGIGTSSPATRLQVSAASGYNEIRVTSGSNSLGLSIDGSVAYLAAFQSTPLTFQTNSAERMRIDSSGNVGIGTSSPGTYNGLLNVKASDRAVIGYFGGTTYAARLGANSSFATVEAVDAATGVSSYQPLQIGGSILRFDTGGSERMRIDASGNVGIGTSAPTVQLQINGTQPQIQWSNPTTGATSNDGTHLYLSGSDFWLVNKETAAMVFATNNTERMRLNSAGNLGLGVVPGANDFTGVLQTGWVGHGITPRSATNLVFNMNANHNGGGWRYGNNGAAALYIQSDAGHAWYNAPSGTAGNAITFTEGMVLNASNNVGIGTGSPGARLHAFVASSGNTLPGNAIGIFESAANNGIAVSAPAANAAGVYFPRSTSAYYAGVERNGTNLVFANNDAERARINSSGDLLVGTTAGAFTSAGRGLIEINGSADSLLGFKVGNAANFYLQATAGANWMVAQSNQINIYTSTAQPITFTTSTLERMRIDASGNLSLGTTVGAARLRVSAGGRVDAPVLGNVTNYPAFLSNNDSAYGLGIGTNGVDGRVWLQAQRADSAVAYNITLNEAGGNVGIGLTNPGYPLSVQTNSSTQGIRLVGRAADSISTLEFTNSAQSVTQGYLQSNSTNLIFGTSTTEKMRIDGSGNLGLGTSSPGVRLDVAGGSIRVGNTHAMTFRNAAGTGTATFTLQSDDNFVVYNATGTPISSFTQGSTNIAVYGSNGSNRMTVDSINNVTSWTVNGSERARIDGFGQFLIGTTSGGRTVCINATDNWIRQSNPNRSWLIGPSTGTSYMLWDETGGGARFTVDTAGNWFGNNAIILGSGFNNDNRIEVGQGRTGNNFAYIDLIGDTTYTDYGLRLLRGNGGPNATSELNHRGTGPFSINVQDAGVLIFSTSNTERFRITSTGAITSSDLADAVGYKGIPQNARTSAYTLALSDIGKHISITTGGVTIPANGSVAFPIGSAITIYNNSASNQTISITSDTLRLAGTSTTGSRTLAQRGICTCVKVAATEWVISGAGLT